jgi:hypothetical protein
MKRTFYLVLITGALTLFSISSCKKDPIDPGGYAGTGANTGPAIVSTELQANNWVQHTSGFYIHTFEGIISQGQSVKVYLVEDGNEIQINHYIHYMGGQLWAGTEFTDLKIYYRSSVLPFASLNIKMVPE